jgi:starch-binding outer membrane protein, SusD/RagB family
MKKYIILFLCMGVGSLFLNSCLEKYLDKAPESGLTEDMVFSKYDNTRLYFDYVYNFLDENITAGGYVGDGVFNASSLKISFVGSLDLDCCCDWCDAGRVMWWQYYKWGPLGDNVNGHFYPYILVPFFQHIRRANMVLQNINKLTDGKQTDIDDLIAQAHFVRAFCHFELFRLWGPMPYLTQPIGPYDQWDIPRLSAHETCLSIAADMDTAYTYFEKAGKMRRDPGPNQVGNLNAPDQNRPSGVAAKGYKARALLYAASPLNEGSSADWQAAATASWEAIEIAEQNGYSLLSAENYKQNYVGTTYTNEQLWACYFGTIRYSDASSYCKQLFCAIFTNSKTSTSGLNPTQGSVDCFETKWGDPLNTQEQRDAATALGHYNEQDPFTNRDPRFYIDIIYNTAPIPGYGTAKIYFDASSGTAVPSELINPSFRGITHTGYYMRKVWGGQSVKNDVSPDYTFLMMRLGELYLDYAEAANEAYGPNTAAPGASITAVQAINTIRGRWGASDLAPVQSQFTTSTESFRPRIKNERNVELCFEGHYYYDIRRWKDAPVTMAGPLMGNMPYKVPVDATYPTGYKYTRLPLSADRQSRWYDAKYYLPFLSTDYYKMKNFDPGQVW